ncbi:MAG: hypothetical protein ACQJCO_06165 [cyanobacterium endosymbiont of Rhopalodia sterrenbergii]
MLSWLVISTYMDCIPKLIVPEESGLLVSAALLEALVIAIKTCLQAPISQLKEMSIISAKRVLK